MTQPVLAAVVTGSATFVYSIVMAFTTVDSTWKHSVLLVLTTDTGCMLL
jgi:hypothetical protein